MAETKWEYRIEEYGSFLRGPKREEIEDYLNALGDEGWEAISLHQTHSSNKIWITIKRPLSTTSRRRRSFPGDEW